MTPQLEVKFVRDEFDRASLHNAITAHIGAAEIPIGPFERRIAYRLYPGTRTDSEDAIRLHSLLAESRSEPSQ